MPKSTFYHWRTTHQGTCSTCNKETTVIICQMPKSPMQIRKYWPKKKVPTCVTCFEKSRKRKSRRYKDAIYATLDGNFESNH